MRRRNPNHLKTMEPKTTEELEQEISQLRCDVITLRVTAGDYLKAAVQYQCSPWDLRIVRAYGIAKTRLEEVLTANADVDAPADNATPIQNQTT